MSKELMTMGNSECRHEEVEMVFYETARRAKMRQLGLECIPARTVSLLFSGLTKFRISSKHEITGGAKNAQT